MPSDPADPTGPETEGDVLGPLRVGPVAHGGHCVARWQGRVVFVRHALPGESVRVRLTDCSQPAYWRGDAIEVLEAAEGRTTPRCPISGPGGCGGCDFQHADLPTQRALKAAVISEQLSHLAGIELGVEVRPVDEAPGADGFGWRTRMDYIARQGRAHLRRHRSNDLVAVPSGGCPLAVAAQPDPHALAVGTDTSDADEGRPHPDAEEGVDLRIATAASGASTVLLDGHVQAGEAVLTESAAGREWHVDAAGFWQVHPRAADALVEAVLDGLDPQPGERAFDLYCGVGLFSGALVDRGVQVWGVELARRAVDQARANVPRARFTVGRVDRVLRRMPARTDLVVLDPPRSGAGKAVVDAIVARRPRAIAYVACDPAALGRDLGRLRRKGYELVDLVALDLFPHTHHVECVAICRPA